MADLYSMAVDLLARVAAYYAGQNVDLPAARYVAPGDSRTIAFDYPALQICVDYISPGQVGQDHASQPGGQKHHGRRYAQFAVTVLRECAAGDDMGNPPTPEQIQADAETNMRDLVLVQTALERVRDGCRTPGGWAPPGAPVAVGRTQPVGPAGTIIAAVGVIQAEVSP